MPIKSSIYSKARDILSHGGVTVDVETEKGIYLFVEGEHQRYDVRLMSDDTFNCTCRLGSLKAGKGVLCSHVVSAILFVAGNRTKGGKEES